MNCVLPKAKDKDRKKKQYLLIKFVVVVVHFFFALLFRCSFLVEANETRISIKKLSWTVVKRTEAESAPRTQNAYIKEDDWSLSEIVLNDDSNRSSHSTTVCVRKVFAYTHSL